MEITAMAAMEAKAPLSPFSYKAQDLKDDEVQIKVLHCGVCHSDLSMLENEWGRSHYPFVGGHEVIGVITKLGGKVTHLQEGQTVGIGWTARSCMRCSTCLSGDHNLCATKEQTIVGRHGGFATYVQAQADWVFVLPEKLDPKKAGPLFCGGITVFNPLIQYGVRPTDRVGVIGIGGLGSLAIQFLNKWGCEVTAFSSSLEKTTELKTLGAHHVVSSRDRSAWPKLNGSFQFLLSTVNVSLDWAAILALLSPKGRLHLVGATLDPLQLSVFSLLGGQKSLSASPTGSPATIATMLDFCARHQILPMVEHFPLSKVNEAFAHLKAGKARYRIILDQDLE